MVQYHDEKYVEMAYARVSTKALSLERQEICLKQFHMNQLVRRLRMLCRDFTDIIFFIIFCHFYREKWKPQDKGYNDIFIPNMKKLSSDYKTYHEALTLMNQRICSELGLYYDTNYNLCRKKN